VPAKNLNRQFDSTRDSSAASSPFFGSLKPLRADQHQRFFIGEWLLRTYNEGVARSNTQMQ